MAELYGVETKRINEAVKNNPERFPVNYVKDLVLKEKNELVENSDRFNRIKHSTSRPEAFTETGWLLPLCISKGLLNRADSSDFFIPFCPSCHGRPVLSARHSTDSSAGITRKNFAAACRQQLVLRFL